MPKLRSLFWGMAALLLLSGCQTADMHYNAHQLTIETDNTDIVFKGRLLAQKNINFSTLFVSQKAIQSSEGNVIVYENARTDISYEFEPTLMRITRIVFDAVRVNLLYTTQKMYIFQLLLPNGQALNLIAQQSETQQIKYMYGMSTKQLDRILNTLQADVRYRPYRNVVLLRNTFNAIQSRWTDRKVHFVPLVVPYRTTPFF